MQKKKKKKKKLNALIFFIQNGVKYGLDVLCKIQPC